MSRDCRLCFYYTWESELLCAVEPELANNSRNASDCKHYKHDDSVYFKDGVVRKNAHELGYAVAVKLPYEWVDHYEGKGMVVVSNDALELGYAVAVKLPYEWEDHYEGSRLIKGMIVVSQGVGNSDDGWFSPAVDLPTNCSIVGKELIYQDYNFNFSESNFGVVVGHSIWRDRRNRQVVGYAEAWLIEHREWYQNPDLLYDEGRLVIHFMFMDLFE